MDEDEDIEIEEDDECYCEVSFFGRCEPCRQRARGQREAEADYWRG